MELVSVVKNEEADLAKKMEQRLLNLPPSSGVLFAGVSVQASTGTSPTIFRVWIGCSRKVDPRVMPTLVQVTLREEVQAGHKIETESVMGSTRS